MLVGAAAILLLPLILVIVGIWRIGTGTQQTAIALLDVARALRMPPSEGSAPAASASYEQRAAAYVQQASKPTHTDWVIVVVSLGAIVGLWILWRIVF